MDTSAETVDYGYGYVLGLTNGSVAFGFGDNGAHTIVFPDNYYSGGDDYSWVKNTQIGMGAFDIGNSIKGGMIDYAVASSAGKSMNSLKRTDYVATLGKTGANYVRAFKVAGGVTFLVSTGISAGLMYNYYNSGGTGSDVAVKSGLDTTMGVVGLFWPIGTGISVTYFIIDAATGGFGGYGDPLKIK